MLDLFAAPPEVVSGAVPRTIAPGVIWDEAAERRFVESVRYMVAHGLMGRGYPREDAERSSRLAIEAGLFRKMLRRELEEAARCRTDASKLEIDARWKRELGMVARNELVKLMRTPLPKNVLEAW